MVERHLRDLERLPDSFHHKLAGYFASHRKGGIYVIDGPVTDLMSKYRAVTPRGFPPGKTWDDVAGVCDWPKHRVILGDTADRGVVFNLPRHDVSLATHETGHALDDALGKESNSSEFRQVYDKLGRLSPYYAQPGEAGRQETFAEGFGAWGYTRHLALDHRADAIANTLGIDTYKQSRGALLDSYFSGLQHRLESGPI